MNHLINRLLNGEDFSYNMLTEDEDINIDVLCDKADKELKRLIDWLKDNEEAFKVQDLKLYSAAMYDVDKKYPLIKKACDDGFYGKAYDPFYDFCNDEYATFIDWCQDQGIDFQKMTKTVWGSNSKFYLYTDDLIELEGNRGKEYGIRLQTTIDNFMDYFGYESAFEADENGLVDRDYIKEWYENDEYVILNLKDIISGSLYTDVTDYYENVIKVYDYIKYVKDNQIKLYESWLDSEVENIKDQYPEIED